LSNSERDEAKRQFLNQQLAAVELSQKRLANLKQNAGARHAELLRRRNLELREIKQSLNRTIASVQARHESAKTNLRGEAIRRDVHLRVNRSLEALESFVREQRLSSLTDARLLEAIQDPAVSGSSHDRARRASVSELLLSVQKQLIQQYEFINVAAHELRTPIMPILAYAEILQEKFGGSSEELQGIVRNALRLQQLAENILTTAKIDSNSLTLHKEKFDLNLLLEQLTKDKALTIRSPDVRILFVPQTEKLYIEADQSRIGQVISNFLDNAIMFTKVGRIQVTSEKTDDRVIVTIRDDGPGIYSEVFPLLFTKFASRSTKGTGLGLYICKKIIEAHGGTIEGRNKSMPGQSGAIFSFSLPL
jgi:signal transduction histidine kinase